jgi:hypothetical protein
MERSEEEKSSVKMRNVLLTTQLTITHDYRIWPMIMMMIQMKLCADQTLSVSWVVPVDASGLGREHFRMVWVGSLCVVVCVVAPSECNMEFA